MDMAQSDDTQSALSLCLSLCSVITHTFLFPCSFNPISMKLLQSSSTWVLVLLLSVVIAGSVNATIFVGDGTAYSDAVPDGSGFACSFRKIFEHTQTYFAAINIEQWEDGLACGKCVNVWCTDDFCTVKDKKIKMQIVDQCPECKKGDIDMSIPAYRDVTGIWPHRLTVNWEWTSCEDIVDGDLLLSPKDNQNQWYHAFYISNAANAIKNVMLNGKIELSRSQFGFFQFHGELGQGPHTLSIESIDGEKLTATVDTFLKSQDLGVQFQKFTAGLGSGGIVSSVVSSIQRVMRLDGLNEAPSTE